MLPVTDDFKSAVISGGLFKTDIDIKVFGTEPDAQGLVHVEFHIKNEQIVSESMKLTQAICDEPDVKFGGAVASSFEIDISRNKDLTGRYITVDCTQKAKDAQGNDHTFTCHLFSGEVFSCKYSKSRLTRKLIAYDRFYWRGRLNCAPVYSSLFLNNSTVTLGMLRAALLSRYNIVEAGGSSGTLVPLPGDDFVIKKDDDLAKSMTLSDAFRMIGELSGVFMLLNGHGDMEYKTISGTTVNETYSYYKTAEADDYARTGFDALETHSCGVYNIVGTDQDHVYDLENPLVTSGYVSPGQSLTDNFRIALDAVTVNGTDHDITPNFQVTYRPFTLKAETRLWLQPGDRISFTIDWYSVDDQGALEHHTSTVKSVILSRRITGISAMTDELSAQGATDFISALPEEEPEWEYTLSASDFEQGTITSSGGNSSNSKRIRTIGFYPTNGNFTITGSAVPIDEEDTLHWWIQGYRDDDLSESGSRYEGDWVTGGTTPTAYDFSLMPYDTAYIRVVIAYSSGSDITTAALDAFSFSFSDPRPSTTPSSGILTASDVVQGGISTTGEYYTGSTTARKRLACLDFFEVGNTFSVTASVTAANPAWTIYWGIQGYSGEDESMSGTEYEGDWIAGGSTPTTYDFSFMPAKTKYVRFYFKYSDNDTITPEELDSFTFYFSPLQGGTQ